MKRDWFIGLTVLDEFYRLVFTPPILIGGVAVTVHVCRTRTLMVSRNVSVLVILFLCEWHTSDCPGLAEETTTERDVVHTRTIFFVPARYNDTRGEAILVIVTHFLEDVGCNRHGRWVTKLLAIGELITVMQQLGYRRTSASEAGSERYLLRLAYRLLSLTDSSRCGRGRV